MTSQTSPAAAAGTWTLGDLTVNRVGLGPCGPERLAANVAAAALRLSPGEMGRLEAIC